MTLASARTLAELLARRAAEQPDATAVVDGELRLSNAELQERVQATARALIAAGVAPGDRVATLAPPSADFWITFLAAGSIGAMWQGLNPKYQRNEYAYLLGDAKPKVVFARTEFDGRRYLDELRALGDAKTVFVALGEQALSIEHPFVATGRSVSSLELHRREQAVREEDPAVIVYTSGTTGQPKGAMLSHRAIVQTALTHVRAIGEGLDCTLCPAPINHVGALNNVCMVVFAAGGQIVS